MIRYNRKFQIFANSVLFVITAGVILPFVLLFMSSVTEENTLIRNGYAFWPEKFSISAYSYIWKQRAQIFRAYGITVIVTAVGTLVNVIFSSLLAYGLSLKELPGKTALTFYVFFTMLFNGGLVPTYLMYTGTFHIKNTILALIVPNFLLSAMNVLLIRTFFRTSIPEALYEAARIDGAGHMRTYTSIVLPLGKPILVTMGLFSALGYWNDWTNGLYYLSGDKGYALYSIQNLLNEMISKIEFLSSNSVAGAASSDLSQLPSTAVRMAIAFVAMLPMIVIYPFLQKYFQKGIALGAVKG